jgi:hypothetical protein
MGTVKAAANASSLVVTVTNGGENKDYTFTLENDILSGTMKDLESTAILFELIYLASVHHGYTREYTSAVLTLDEVGEYTVDDEGLAFDKATLKVSINMAKMNFTADMSSVYITVDDLQDVSEYISGENPIQVSMGYVTVIKDHCDNDKDVSFIVIERNSLTQNSYKSMLSVLNVMFNSSKAPTYFSSIYPDFSTGNIEKNGIKVDTNPTPDSFETDIMKDGTFKFVRVTIDKEQFQAAFNSENTAKIPAAGKDTKWINFFKMLAVISGTTLILFFVYNKKINKKSVKIEG